MTQTNMPTSTQVATVARPDQDPRTRLVALLTTWGDMNETEWTQDAVDRLKDDILDVFHDHPEAADRWYRAWRALHPEARLA